MIKLEKCPHCGGEVMLCKLNTMLTVAEFSIVCTDCGLETRIYANPMANCCFDMSKAINEIVEKWNRRESTYEHDTRRSDCCFGGKQEAE